MPATGSVTSFGERVPVAWEPTREAARALAAAMPILQRATSVHLLAGEQETAGAELESCLRAHGESCLRAHGVEAPLKHPAPLPESAPGEGLLSLATECDADLMVMGCYGHSRAREWILGGATRTVLAAMMLQVLMAH